MKRYNNVIRRFLEKEINAILKEGLSLRRASLIMSSRLYNSYLRNFEEKVDCYKNKNELPSTIKRFEIFFSMICQIIYSDSIKILSYKQNHLLLDEDDLMSFIDIFNIEDFDDLYTKCVDDPDLFSNMIKLSYQFQISNGLTKALQTKNLSEEDNQKILNISPVHNEDLKYYNAPITLDRVINNYINQLKNYKASYDVDFEEFLIEQIASFIRELSLVDKKNATSICLEIAKKDYITCKYLIDKIIDIIDLEEHIVFYEKNNKIDIVNRMLYDNEYLKTSILFAISLKVNKEFAGHKINEDDIYLSNTKEVLSKLK